MAVNMGTLMHELSTCRVEVDFISQILRERERERGLGPLTNELELVFYNQKSLLLYVL